MFRSRASRFNIVDATPFGRDVVEELANACARRGMKLGLYYSQDLDWSEPNGGGYTRGHTNHGPHDDECMAWTNDWDFPENDKKDYSQCFESKIVPQGEGNPHAIWRTVPDLVRYAHHAFSRAESKRWWTWCIPFPSPIA